MHNINKKLDNNLWSKDNIGRSSFENNLNFAYNFKHEFLEGIFDSLNNLRYGIETRIKLVHIHTQQDTSLER